MISAFQKISPHRKKLDFGAVLPWAWLILAYCITMGLLILHGRAYIDSDMGGEMILADLLNQEHSIISPNWGYSTEIRVFYLQAIYRIALLIFPNNWFAARMLSQAIWLILTVAAILYAGRGLGLQGNGIWAAAAFVCPFGFYHFWFNLFGGQYLVYIFILFISLGLVVRLLKPAPIKRQIFRSALLILISFVFGLSSIKVMMALNLPLLAASVFTIIFDLHEAPDRFPATGSRFFIVSFVSTIFAGLGFLINSSIFAAKYDFMNQTGRVWESLDFNALLDSIFSLLSLFGFPDHERLFSLYGILAAFSLILIGAIIVCTIFLIGQYFHLSLEKKILLLTTIFSILIQAVIFSLTSGSIGASNAYWWLTSVPLVLFLLQCGYEQFDFRFKYGKDLCAIAFMFCIIATSFSSVHHFFTVPSRAVPDMLPAEEWLVENGYRDGYAVFWKANVLTEWSSGQLDVRVVSGDTLDVTEPHSWLEKHSHQTPPKGKVFLLVTASELWGAHKESIRSDYNVYWDENDYMIMAFDSYDEMVTALQNAHEG